MRWFEIDKLRGLESDFGADTFGPGMRNQFEHIHVPIEPQNGGCFFPRDDANEHKLFSKISIFHTFPSKKGFYEGFLQRY